MSVACHKHRYTVACLHACIHASHPAGPTHSHCVRSRMTEPHDSSAKELKANPNAHASTPHTLRGPGYEQAKCAPTRHSRHTWPCTPLEAADHGATNAPHDAAAAPWLTAAAAASELSCWYVASHACRGARSALTGASCASRRSRSARAAAASSTAAAAGAAGQALKRCCRGAATAGAAVGRRTRWRWRW